MRINVSLDDQLANQVRRVAAARGVSVSVFISGTLTDALKRREQTEPPPFRVVTVSGVYPRHSVNLDKSSDLEAEDDESRFKR